MSARLAAIADESIQVPGLRWGATSAGDPPAERRTVGFTKLDRIVRSLRLVAFTMSARRWQAQPRRSIDPTEPIGRSLFKLLAMMGSPARLTALNLCALKDAQRDNLL